jgi:hypothetical protein
MGLRGQHDAEHEGIGAGCFAEDDEPECMFCAIKDFRSWHHPNGRDCTPDVAPNMRNRIVQAGARSSSSQNKTHVRTNGAVRHGILNSIWQGVRYAGRFRKPGADVDPELVRETNTALIEQYELDLDRCYVCRVIENRCTGKGYTGSVAYEKPVQKSGQKAAQSQNGGSKSDGATKSAGGAPKTYRCETCQKQTPKIYDQ